MAFLETWNLESHWSGTVCSTTPKCGKHLTFARLPLIICKLHSGSELLRKALERLSKWVSSFFPAALPSFPALLAHYIRRIRDTLADFSTVTSMKAKTKSRNSSSDSVSNYLCFEHGCTALQQPEHTWLTTTWKQPSSFLKTGSWAHPWGSNSGSLGGASQLY